MTYRRIAIADRRCKVKRGGVKARLAWLQVDASKFSFFHCHARCLVQAAFSFLDLNLNLACFDLTRLP